MLLALSACTFDKRGFYLFAPVFLYFQLQFYATGTTTAFRLYSLLVIAKAAVELKEFRLRLFILPSFCVVLTHVALCLWDRDSSLGLSATLDLMLVLVLICRVPQDKETLRGFFLMMGLVGLCAGVYGYLTDNFGTVALGRSGVYSNELKRFMLTFIDPNYAGFFLNVAFYSILCLRRPLKLYIRAPILCALFYFILLCSSVTNFVCFGLCACVYIVLRWPGKSPLLLLALAAALAAAVYAIVYVDAVGNISALSGIKTRLVELLRNSEKGDVESLSSGRSELWAYYWDYFKNQGLLRRLVGGNVLTATYFDAEMTAAVGMGTHLAYLQSLLLYGYIGTGVIFGTALSWIAYNGTKYFICRRRDADADVWRAYLICKIALLFFATSVDMFPDWRFMLMLFI